VKYLGLKKDIWTNCCHFTQVQYEEKYHKYANRKLHEIECILPSRKIFQIFFLMTETWLITHVAGIKNYKG
jgi:hypothetical protein